MRAKLNCFIAGLIFSCLFAVGAVSAQTGIATKIARKIDRRKMNTNCTGNFLAGEPSENGDIPGDVENLTKIYDFALLRAAAIKNRFKIVDERKFVPVRSMPMDEFNRNYNSGAPFVKGDPPRQIGALRLVQEGDSHVEFEGQILEIEKRIAADENWTLRLEYTLAGGDDFPQEVEISQSGRCNLSDDYIRARAKNLLDRLGIESDWTTRASVLISTIN